MVKLLIPMEISLKASLLVETEKVKMQLTHTLLRRVRLKKYIMESGNSIINMELENKIMLDWDSIMDIGRKEKKMGKEL